MTPDDDRIIALEQAVKARDTHEDTYVTMRRAEQFQMFLVQSDRPIPADDIPF